MGVMTNNRTEAQQYRLGLGLVLVLVLGIIKKIAFSAIWRELNQRPVFGSIATAMLCSRKFSGA